MKELTEKESFEILKVMEQMFYALSVYNEDEKTLSDYRKHPKYIGRIKYLEPIGIMRLLTPEETSIAKNRVDNKIGVLQKYPVNIQSTQGEIVIDNEALYTLVSECDDPEERWNKWYLEKVLIYKNDSLRRQGIIDDKLQSLIIKYTHLVNKTFKADNPIDEQPVKEAVQESPKTEKTKRKAGGRPKDPELPGKKKQLSKDYYNLTVNDDLNKSTAIKKLIQIYGWKKSTIETYLK